MTQKREGESDDSPSLCHHSETTRRWFIKDLQSTNKGLA